MVNIFPYNKCFVRKCVYFHWFYIHIISVPKILSFTIGSKLTIPDSDNLLMYSGNISQAHTPSGVVKWEYRNERE
jgi:hypothetical protein